MPRLPDLSNTASRRAFLFRAGAGLSQVALAATIGRAARTDDGQSTAARPLAPKPTHHAPRAKRVIWLFMHGGPSHVDLFDPKPELEALSGKPLPESFGMVMTRRAVAKNGLLPARRPFRPRGQSGFEISDYMPRLAECADELCVLRGCHGDSVNHPQSVFQINTGSILMGRPSLGSWVSYGLGTENQDMPAFVVIPDPGGGVKGGSPAWGSGYLPAIHQGTLVRPSMPAILDLAPPRKIPASRERDLIDLVQKLNRRHLAARDADDELWARIESYETAFRMQAAAPSLVDFSQETEETKRLYGIDQPQCKAFAERCLLARRLVEAGVRFVQLYCGDGNGWDAHGKLDDNHGQLCQRSDQPVAALLTDLKRRGLLDDTLVIWGGEFGRMPMSEGGDGRDHNPWGYTIWLAGGGVKRGIAHGATDAVGLRAVEGKVHVHDLHATILHLLGIDHEQLTYFHNGREERLTDVAGRVVSEIIA